MMISRMLRSACAAAVVSLGLASGAWADSVNFFGEGPSTGAKFVGTIDYQYTSDAAYGNLSIYLKNTSSAEVGGQITAFVFNIAGDQAYEVLTPNPTDVLLENDRAWWSLTSEDELTDTDPASPYGQFEAGVAVGDLAGKNDAHFGGSGGESSGEGLAPGESYAFQFRVQASDLSALSALTASSFITELSTGPTNKAAFLVRFKSLTAGEGSDKVVGLEGGGGDTNLVPLPASVWSGFLMLAALGAWKMRTRVRGMA